MQRGLAELRTEPATVSVPEGTEEARRREDGTHGPVTLFCLSASAPALSRVSISSYLFLFAHTCKQTSPVKGSACACGSHFASISLVTSALLLVLHALYSSSGFGVFFFDRRPISYEDLSADGEPSLLGQFLDRNSYCWARKRLELSLIHI